VEIVTSVSFPPGTVSSRPLAVGSCASTLCGEGNGRSEASIVPGVVKKCPPPLVASPPLSFSREETTLDGAERSRLPSPTRCSHQEGRRRAGLRAQEGRILSATRARQLAERNEAQISTGNHKPPHERRARAPYPLPGRQWVGDQGLVDKVSSATRPHRRQGLPVETHEGAIPSPAILVVLVESHKSYKYVSAHLCALLRGWLHDTKSFILHFMHHEPTSSGRLSPLVLRFSWQS